MFLHDGILEDGTPFVGDPNVIRDGTGVDIADDFCSGWGDGFNLNIDPIDIEAGKLERNGKMIFNTNYCVPSRSSLRETELIPLTRTATNQRVSHETANWCAMYNYKITFRNDTNETRVIKAFIHTPTTTKPPEKPKEPAPENWVIINYDNETKYGFFTSTDPYGKQLDTVFNTWNWLTVTLPPHT